MTKLYPRSLEVTIPTFEFGSRELTHHPKKVTNSQNCQAPKNHINKTRSKSHNTRLNLKEGGRRLRKNALFVGIPVPVGVLWESLVGFPKVMGTLYLENGRCDVDFHQLYPLTSHSCLKKWYVPRLYNG